jgi:hypothetical protein
MAEIGDLLESNEDMLVRQKGLSDPKIVFRELTGILRFYRKESQRKGLKWV